MDKFSRRRLLAGGTIAAGLPILHKVLPHRGLHGDTAVAAGGPNGGGHGAGAHRASPVRPGRSVDHRANGFNPTEMLRDFDWGRTRRLPGGRVLREWELVSADKEIEIAPGLKFAAWTYNGRVPGPTLRCREGDLLRIHFANGSQHPHTIHFHGVHQAFMDGMPGVGEDVGGGLIKSGERFTYEFEAAPFGFHHYHCHATPLAAHIAKGLYGAFIVDPRQGREDADELVMVMNGFDTNFDSSNEVYAVNTVGFHYQAEPIKVRRGQLVRIYLLNILEFDQINSFHIHGNFFNYFPTGTSLQPAEYTDTIMQAQGQRGILELRFPYAGRFMFHAHKTEFAELGWLGFFEVQG
jgi:FtsP/CotA-like multicopper oxidase with cupredoxin domain